MPWCVLSTSRGRVSTLPLVFVSAICVLSVGGAVALCVFDNDTINMKAHRGLIVCGLPFAVALLLKGKNTY